MKRLLSAVERTEARIVVTSDWRRWDDTRNALAKGLRMAGGRRSLIMGHTAYLPSAGPGAQRRAEEINDWLAQSEKGSVEAYVVVDDDFIPDHPGVFIPNGMFTGGLQDEHVERIVQKLGEKQA